MRLQGSKPDTRYRCSDRLLQFSIPYKRLRVMPATCLSKINQLALTKSINVSFSERKK